MEEKTLAILLAIGLDPKRSIIFFQSDVPAHVELMWTLSCSASTGYLSRMTQWKNKIALSDETSIFDSHARARLKLGLFSYPVLQAADILVHGTTHVPVGEDQIQHLEFARECAETFNKIYGNTLVKPNVILSPAKRIMSLREPHLKMSKSHEDPRSRVLLTDSPDEIQQKIKGSLTDSEEGISYDRTRRPGISNLLDILAYLDNTGRQPCHIIDDCSGFSKLELKEAVADKLIQHLGPIRIAYADLMKKDDRDGYLRHIAAQGAISAMASASATLDTVYKAIGIR